MKDIRFQSWSGPQRYIDLIIDCGINYQHECVYDYETAKKFGIFEKCDSDDTCQDYISWGDNNTCIPAPTFAPTVYNKSWDTTNTTKSSIDDDMDAQHQISPCFWFLILSFHLGF